MVVESKNEFIVDVVRCPDVNVPCKKPDINNHEANTSKDWEDLGK